MTDTRSSPCKSCGKLSPSESTQNMESSCEMRSVSDTFFTPFIAVNIVVVFTLVNWASTSIADKYVFFFGLNGGQVVILGVVVHIHILLSVI